MRLSPYLQPKTGYEAYKEDKKKPQSKAPTRALKFENPNYIGKSESKKTYQWETDNLKTLPIKQYGRSYNDKFTNWAKSQGIQDHEMSEFRQWMDSKEDKQPIRGTETNNILKDMEKRTRESAEKVKQNLKNPPKLDYKPKKEESKKEKDKPDNMLTSAFTAAKEAINPFDDVSMEEATKKYMNKKQSKKFQEVARGANRAVDSASLGVMGNIDKKVNKRDPYYNSQREMGEGGGTDMLTTGLGYLAPGIGQYKALNALKVGKGLTAYGTKGLSQRILSEGAKGALTGGTMAGAEVGIRESLNPKDQNWKDNAKWIGFGTATGAIADPLMYGAGKTIGKGFEKASGKAMKELVPSEKQTADAISSVISKDDVIKPKEYTMPDGKKVQLKNRVTKALDETQTKLEEIKPKAEAQTKEFQEAVQQQYDYLKESMGKGVEYGTTGNGLPGNSKEVTGTFAISKNGKWYQDFFKQHNRKPTEKELWEIAEQHVKEGFQDEAVGDIPKWQPKTIQEIDDQIDEVTTLLREQPEQEEALQPILTALEEEKVIALRDSETTVKKAAELQKNADNLQRTLNGEEIQAMQGDTFPLREASGSKQFKDMGFWENAVNKVKKAVGSKNVYEQPITRREIIENMNKNLGVTIRTGRLNASEEVKGVFKVNPEVIRSRQHGDVQVLSHEIGHSLDKQFNLSSESFDDELMKLGANTSGKDYTPEQVRKEGLAEFIRLFLTDPNQALKEAPNFSQHFDTTLPKKTKNGLLKTQADIDTWIEQGPALRSRGKMDFSGKEQTSISEKIDKVYSQFVDKFDQLKKVEKAVSGKVNDASQSLYKKARLSIGAPKKAEMILNSELKPIFDGIDKHGITMKDISQYVKDVHAQDLENMGERVAIEAGDELNLLAKDVAEMDTDSILKMIDDFQTKYGVELDEGQVASIAKGEELELTDDQLFLIAEQNRIETGVTKEEIQATLKKFDTPEMKEIQKKVVAYNNKLLDMLVDGKILTREAVDAMKEKHPNYVPFFRFFEEDMTQSLGNGGQGFANLTNPVKRLKGSFRDVIDPLESMVKNTFAVINAVEKNKVGLELSRLADIEGAGAFIERLDGAQQVKKEHIVTVFENGEKVQYQLDKDLYESIQQLDEDRANKVIQFLSYPTSMLRAGATLTPEFMLRNPIRDQFQAFVVSNYGYNPIIDLPMGVIHTIGGKVFNKSNTYKQWVMKGGGYGNYLSQDRNYLRETLKTLKKEGNQYQKGFKTIVNPKEWMRILQAFSEFSEEATKVGEFRKAIKKGATPEEAAFQSRDLMDFGRVGSDIKQWNRAVAFLNANLQGKDRIARAFKQNPIRTTIRGLTGVTFPAIAAYVAMDKYANEKQKETYENAPKWLKDTFFMIPIPGTDVVARVPKPFDLAPVFANPVPYIMDHYKNNDPEAWEEFLKRQFISIMDIPHMLTGLAPVLENVTNYSFFTGGPIVPRRDQDLLPQDQYGVSTSLTARTVGNLTKTSPYKVDNLIRGYGAGLGKYATSGMDKLLEKFGAGTLPPQEAKKWSELPVVNAFTVDSTGGGQIMTDFYDTMDKLTKERNSAKRNQEGYEEGDDVDYDRVDDYKYLNKVSREISDLRNAYRQIQGSYDLTPEMKRTQLDELDRQMNQLAREALISIGEKTR